jgi:hypothetical protein
MAKKVLWSPSDEDRRMLSEHLVYEVEMMFFLAERLMRTAGTVPDWSMRNAEVESLAVHVRQLIDFFWSEKPQTADKRDAFASDFFDAGEWARIRPTRPNVLGPALRRKVGWGVAHLTYDRAWSTPKDKQWPTIEIAQALAPTVLRFARSVESAKLAHGAVDRIARCAEPVLARKAVIGPGSVATSARPTPRS